MYDYNFFENYKVKKRNGSGGTTRSVLIFFLFAFLMGGLIGNLIYQNNKMTSNIHQLNEKLTSKDSLIVIKRINEKKNLLSQLEQIKTDVISSNETMSTSSPINQLLFTNILKSLPSDAQLISMTIDRSMVILNGKAGLRSAIAEFEHSLRLSISATQISVSTIELTESEYTFAMTINFGGE